MTEKVGQHVHCHMCGKVIPVTEALCSEECKEKYQAMLKKGKMLRYVMFALMFIFLMMILYSASAL
jgi:predicted nucleic acid-binding Zn ribbon protein